MRAATVSRPGPPSARQIGEPHVRRQQHEQHANQQHRELLLELEQRSLDVGAHVAPRPCRQIAARIPLSAQERVAALEDREHQREREDVLEPLGHGPAAPQQQRDHAPPTPPTAKPSPRRSPRPLAPASAPPSGSPTHLERDDGDERADRVDEDALGLEDGAEVACEPNAAHQRRDDRGTGDDDERAEQDRLAPGPSP